MRWPVKHNCLGALAVIHQAMMGDAMMDKGKGNEGEGEGEGEANGLPSCPLSRGSLGREGGTVMERAYRNNNHNHNHN